MEGNDVLFEVAQSPVTPVPQAQLLPSGYGGEKEFDERDYQSHRNVYVAVHVPYSMPRHHRHKHKRKHHHHHKSHSGSRLPDLESPATPEKESLPPEPKTPLDPCDRVKFILGTEETDNPCDACTHSIFTELEELHYDEHDQRMEWKETARWIKFEEDVEEGGDKWSKPHVATLSLHSLFELRSCMMKGTVLLDLEANNLAQISDYVLDDFVAKHQLDAENREKVRVALLQRHKHQNTKDHDKKFLEHIRSLGDIGKHGSTGKSLDAEGNGGTSGHSNFPFSAPNLGVFGKVHRKLSSQLSNQSSMENGNGTSGFSKNKNGSKNGSRRQSDAGVLQQEGSEEDIHHLPKPDSHFMKKLPPGSEASNVLVGEVDFLSHPIIAFVRLSQGRLLGDLTEVPIPTRFLFILLAPKGNHQRYHEIGRSIATLMSDEVFHDVAYKARNRDDLLAGVDEFLDKVTVLPPGEWDPQIRLEPPPRVPSQVERRVVERKEDGGEEPPSPVVTCTKWPFGGLVQDVKRRYPRYLRDILDGFNLQALASIIFIYFANITPAITFGGVLSEYTNGAMGPIEMILAVGIGNLFFAPFAGQPLVVLGGTGPTLIFEDIVFQFCSQNNIPYLNFRFWIGLWTAIMMIILVAVNASAIMRLFTRFTEEIFSALISFIFIYEALRNLWRINVNYPYNKWILLPTIRRDCDCYQYASESDLEQGVVENRTNLGSFWDHPDLNCSGGLLRYEGDDCSNPEDMKIYPNVFFMSVILFFGTFLLSFYLKRFRRSRFFNSFTRRIISDFAVLISVIVWVSINQLADVRNVPTLDVPDILRGRFFTDPNRTLIVNPFGNGLQGWAVPAAIIPAFLATVLLFMDQQITALIVNRKDHKLKKGSGYHLDLLIVGILIAIHSFLGLPWVVGATVRSITHVQSLFIYSPCTAPGERPKFLGVREQRVTLFLMAVLLGLSVVASRALQLLPLPLLYGIFLYIGVASLYGVQFVERLFLLLMPNKYKPDYEYLRHIPNRRIHAYTLVQVVFLAVLCIFKVVQQISIVFPIMVLLLVVGRWLVGFLFSRHDLEILDDPIPEKLYCKRFRSDRDKSKHPTVLEEGPAEAKSDTDVKGEANGSKPQLVKKESAFNMTQAVDRCQLWQNMVRNLDSPIPSPRRKSHTNTQPNSSSNFAPGSEKSVPLLPPAYQSTTV